MSLSKSAQSIKHPGVTKPMQLKPVVLPKDLIILVDTREQQPLFTGNPQVHIDTVHYGDYTIKGFEPYFAIERKKQSDLWTYCSSEMNTRTKRKMANLTRLCGVVGLLAWLSRQARMIYWAAMRGLVSIIPTWLGERSQALR